MEILAAIFLWLFKTALLVTAWEAFKAVKKNGFKKYFGL